MSLASVYAYRPYAPPRNTRAGLATLYSAYGPDGGPTTAPAPAPPAPTGHLTPTQTSSDDAEGLYVGRGSRPGGTPVNGSGTPATGPPRPPAPSGPSGPTGSGPGSYNFDNDPILARVRALNQRLIADAEAQALAGRKQSEITFGFDPSLQYEDQGTEQAARQNPFSTLAQLLAAHNQRDQANDQQANLSNLFYSSARAGAVRGENRQEALQQSLGNQDFQKVLATIAQQLLGVKNDAQSREIDAEQAAYERALAYGGGGGGGGGGPGGLENPGQFNDGFTPDQLNSSAAQYAASHTANGQPYQPGLVMQEGHVEVRNGVPGVYIKYRTAAGDSTEWTPIG